MITHSLKNLKKFKNKITFIGVLLFYDSWDRLRRQIGWLTWLPNQMSWINPQKEFWWNKNTQKPHTKLTPAINPSIFYTCLILHSKTRGFAGAYPSCNRAVVGYTLDKTAVHHRALKQTQMKENCVDFLLWTSLPFYGLKSQKGLSLISALTSNPCLGLSWCGPDYNGSSE